MIKKDWTEEETKFMRDNYGNMSVHVICEKLGRNRNSIIGKASRMGLSTSHNITQMVSAPRIDPTPMKYQKRPDRKLYKYEDLQPHQCQYPFGVDNKDFCGLDRTKGAYCEEHYKRCYK